MIIDSHMHLVSPDRVRYPLQETPSGTRHPDHDPGRTWEEWKRTPDEFRDLMRGAGIERAVIVQCHPTYGTDCSFAIDTSSEDPRTFRAVVQFDHTSPSVAEEVARLAKLPVVTGMRMRAMFSPELLEPSSAELWDAVAEAGLTIEVVVAGLDRLAPWIERVAPVPVVLHGPAPELMAAGAGETGVSLLADLAAHPNCYVKLSTGILQMGAQGADPARFVEAVAGVVGADRIVWGSNFPATTGMTYADMAAFARQACRTLSVDERDSYLAGLAGRLWW